jgi:glucosamine 6-phosphate synthetase-like amidotransferase/phosphosugar isomerase protein
MCGLFGLARPAGAGSPGATARALLLLGRLAEERGVDAAGLAYWPTPRPDTADPSMEFADVTVDGWRVLRRIGRFGELALRGTRTELKAARVVLGHTRHATQGNVHLLVNASPLAAGPVLGTHNGDVTADVLRSRYPWLAPVGETDSELLFGALAGARDPAAVVDVLAGLEGRAALAWVDRDKPHRLWLARTALSPLAVALTTDGDLLWASNPDWLRRVAVACGLAFSGGGPALLPEGTLLAFDVGERVRYAGRHAFLPRARPSDAAVTWSVWRGFTASDRAADQAALLSTDVLAPTAPTPTTLPVPVPAAAAELDRAA